MDFGSFGARTAFAAKPVRRMFPIAAALLFALLAALVASSSGVQLAYAASTVEVQVTAEYNQGDDTDYGARTMLQMVNDFRTGKITDGGRSVPWAYASDGNVDTSSYADLDTLTYDYELEKIAMQRAMETALQFSHTRPTYEASTNDSSVYELYPSGIYNSRGENIAMGWGGHNGTAKQAFESWCETSYYYSGQGHRRSMLSRSFNRIGIAHVIVHFQGDLLDGTRPYSNYKTDVHFWVQEFGYCTSSYGKTSTTAAKGNQTKTVEILESNIDLVSVNAKTQKFEVECGKTIELDGIETRMRLKETRPKTFDLKWSDGYISVGPFMIAVAASASAVSADTSIASASGLKVTGNKVGRTQLTISSDLSGATPATAEVVVTPRSLADAQVTVPGGPFTYNGDEQTPAPTVVLDGKTLSESVDYTVSYSENVNAGEATVQVTGMGNYTGSASGTFTIEPLSFQDADVQSGPDPVAEYTGEPIDFDFDITCNGRKLVKGVDYEFDDSKCVRTGVTAGFTRGKGNYTGLLGYGYEIKPAKLMVKNGKSVTVARSVPYGTMLSALPVENAEFVAVNTGKDVSGTFSLGADRMLGAGLYSTSYKFTPDDDNYEVCTGFVSFEVERATPQVIEAPSVEAGTYNPVKTLSGYPLVGGKASIDGGETSVEGTWEWVEPDVVPSVPGATFACRFVPADKGNFDVVTCDVDVVVNKAQLGYGVIAEGITYGQTLASSNLRTAAIVPDGMPIPQVESCNWVNPGIMPTVADSGVTEYEVQLIPVDADNYETQISYVTLEVAKAEWPAARPAAEYNPAYSYATLGNDLLADCPGWAFDEGDLGRELEPGVTETFVATYTDDDAPNYENTSAQVKVTRAECDHLTELRGTYEATCEADGYTGDRYCTICGALTESGEAIPALGHSWGEWRTTVEPTCSGEGMRMRTCDRCGKIETESIEALGHAWFEAPTVDVAPTCTEEGSRAVHCERCGEVREGSRETLARIPHDFSEWVRDAEPTCSAEGHEYLACAACGKRADAGDGVEGEIERAVPALPHEFGTWKTVTEPTCAQEGLEQLICTICGEPKEGTTRAVAKLSHEFGSWRVVKEATEAATGLRERTCSHCGEVEQQTISKLKPKPDPMTTTISGDISPDNPVAAEVVERQIMGLTSDNDPAGSTFSLLQAKGVAKSKSAVKLSWKRVSGATGYVIYGNKCGKGKKYQKIATVAGSSFTQKKLKKGTYYKYLVVAVRNSATLATGKTIHVATKGGKVGNAKSVEVKAKKKVTLKKGKKLKLKAKAVPQSKKLKVKKHRAISYDTTNPSVATVSKKGVIQAKKPGICTVYAYAQNGVCKAVKVTVK